MKLAEAFGAVGIRATEPGDEVDDKIMEMIETPRPVILDCRVDQDENCFPMIPSGAAHYEMLLGPRTRRRSRSPRRAWSWSEAPSRPGSAAAPL